MIQQDVSRIITFKELFKEWFTASEVLSNEPAELVHKSHWMIHSLNSDSVRDSTG